MRNTSQIISRLAYLRKEISENEAVLKCPNHLKKEKKIVHHYLVTLRLIVEQLEWVASVREATFFDGFIET